MNPVPYLRGAEIIRIMEGVALSAVNSDIGYSGYRPVLEMKDEVVIAMRGAELAPDPVGLHLHLASFRDSLMAAREYA